MYFKLTNSLNGMFVRRESDLPLEVEIDEKNKIVLWMREVEHEGKTIRQLCCDMIAFLDPPKRVSETLRALREGQLLLDEPPQIHLPHRTLSGEMIVDLDGAITPNWRLALSQMPTGARPWLNDTGKELSAELVAKVRTLRWFSAATGSHRPFALIDLTWSDDGLNWNWVPTDTDVRLVESEGLDTSSGSIEQARVLIRARFNEPFGHELCREAKGQVWSAPRSALLIALSALETGAKSHISHLVPASDAILEKLQSPPVLTLLQEVIPKLHERHGVECPHLPLSSPAKEYLRKWVTQRNQVAHGTKESVDAEKLDDFVIFVTDLLYVLDAAQGHKWALDRLASDFLRDN